MKKFLALLMAALMLLSCGSALAEFDKHIDMTVTNRGILTAGVDYTADDFYAWMCDKFNITIEPSITDSATHDATVSLWINNGDMPDVVEMVDFNYTAYCEWADQGLLAPLPEGWETKYPNIKNALEKSMILDYLTIDGKVYGIPADIFCNYIDMPVPVAHPCLYYRKDWADALGIELGNIVTLEQVKDYCLKCIEKDMSGSGNTIGISTRVATFVPAVMDMVGYKYGSFVKGENGYVWGPTMDGVTNQIKVLRDLFVSGVLDPDFYLLDSNTAQNRFYAGTAACLFNDGGPGNETTCFTKFETNFPDLEADDCIGVAVLSDSEGIVHAEECTNFWTIKYFSPSIDPDTFDRVLAMVDYFNDPAEGQVTEYKGIPGVDWQWLDGGIDTSIRDAEKPSAPSLKLICTWGTNSDELHPMYNPMQQPKAIECYLRNMQNKSNGDVIRLDYDYEFYSSPVKSVYSVAVDSKIAGLAADTTLDIDAEWAKFISDNEGMWKPLQDELNQVFCGK